MNARRIGLGDSTSDQSSIQALIDASSNPSAMQSAVQDALSANADTSAIAKIGQGVQLYSSVTPAVSLASKIAGGGVPSDAEIAAGLTAVAAAVGGPTVGAAMGVITAAVIGFETGLQAIFSALGLYTKILPSYTYTGFFRNGVDVIPYGPSDSNWMHIRTYADLMSREFGGDLQAWPHRPPPNMTSDFYITAIETTFETALYHLLSNEDKVCWMYSTRPASQTIHFDVGDVDVSIPQPAKWQDSAVQNNATPIYYPNEFDLFVAHLVAADLELWANAQPYLKLRDLLSGAAQVWNSAHSSSSSMQYSPYALQTTNDAYWPEHGSKGTSIVSEILGPLGSVVQNQSTTSLIQNAQPITINGVGPGALTATIPSDAQASAAANAASQASAVQALNAAANADHSPAPTTTQVAASTNSTSTAMAVAVGVPAAVGAAGVIYALATHQAIGAVFGTALSKVWSHLKGWGSDAAALVRRNPLEAWEETTTVQTLLFPREEYSTSQAKAWARRHGYRHSKVDVTTRYVRLRQIDPRDFRRGTFRTISFGQGIQAVVGHLK